MGGAVTDAGFIICQIAKAIRTSWKSSPSPPAAMSASRM